MTDIRFEKNQTSHIRLRKFMLTLHYALTKNDYSNYYTYVAWDAPGKLKKRSLYYLRQLGSVVFFITIFYFSGLFYRSSCFTFIFIGFILLSSILSITGFRSTIMKQAEKLSDDPENASLFNPTVITISEAGILLKDDLTERKFQWAAFIKKLENKEYYFLFYNSLEAVIIPKRVFKTESEKVLFDNFLIQFLSFDAEVGHLVN